MFSMLTTLYMLILRVAANGAMLTAAIAQPLPGISVFVPLKAARTREGGSRSVRVVNETNGQLAARGNGPRPAAEQLRRLERAGPWGGES